MLTALLLVEEGVHVMVIDREPRPATHSYACGLHPYSLKLLERLRLLDQAQAVGRRLVKVGLYTARGREADVSLSKLPVDHPYILVLPQTELEALLAERLRERGGEIRWNYRLSGLKQDEDGVVAEVDKLVGTAAGSALPRWHWVVGQTIEVAADYVIGADGHHSLVRRLLGIENEHVAPAEVYVAYEFEPERATEDEVCLVLGDGVQSVLWPLPAGRCRWSFQLEAGEQGTFPEKDRSPFWLEDSGRAERTWERLQDRLRSRAPWFKAGVKDLSWAVDIQFQRRVVREFGNGRCWLAGDSAHQTAPGGIQSMNVGFREAETLASAIVPLLRNAGNPESLVAYGRAYREEWLRLLGAKDLPRAGSQTNPWVREHLNGIMAGLPASGQELKALLSQLGLEAV